MLESPALLENKFLKLAAHCQQVLRKIEPRLKSKSP
jgi:hypothetical protein